MQGKASTLAFDVRLPLTLQRRLARDRAQDQVRDSKTTACDGSPSCNDLSFEPFQGEVTKTKQPVAVVELERIDIADCEAVRRLDPKGVLPSTAIDVRPVRRDLGIRGSRIRRRDHLLWHANTTCVRANPGGLPSRARAFNDDDHSVSSAVPHAGSATIKPPYLVHQQFKRAHRLPVLGRGCTPAYGRSSRGCWGLMRPVDGAPA